MATPQILIETVSPTTASLVVEAVNDDKQKNLWITGIFAQSNIQNQNQRVYPRNQMIKAVEEACSRMKTNNGILGELDHPESLVINLDRVSHIITELKMNGDNVIGKAKIFGGDHGTPMGRIAESLIRNGVQLGVSTRGTGSVNESTGEVDDFVLLTCDIVANPSAAGALPKAVMESLDYAKNVEKVVSLSETVRHDPAAQKYFEQEMVKAIKAMVDKGLMTVRKP